MLKLSDYLTIPRDELHLADLLEDPIWRICNCYKILDREGVEVVFRPKPPQMVVLEEVFINGEKRILVLKSRQVGFSTEFEIIGLDQAIYVPNLQMSIVDQSQTDASKKLDKIKFAYEKLEDDLKHGKPLTDSASEFSIGNGSKIYAGLRARGGTNQVGHVSEWGPISANDGKRAQEIKTGALPTIPISGMFFNESTFQGGRGGPFFEQIERAKDTVRTAKDCKLLFVPWWADSDCVLEGDAEMIDKETNDYLDKLEVSERVKLTGEQRVFYFATKREQGDDIFQEYPSTIEEALNAKVPGAIYINQITRAESEGRISDDITYREGFPCYSSWDLGGVENQRVIVFQIVGNNIDILEGMEGDIECETPSQWAAYLKSRPYRFGSHFLPHDGATSYRAQLAEAGLENVVCLDKPMRVWNNIDDAKDNFSRCRFNKTGCASLIESLKAYRSKLELDRITWMQVPVHNWASHYATAFGYIHQAIRDGRIIDRSAIPRQPMKNLPPVVTGIARYDQRKTRRF